MHYVGVDIAKRVHYAAVHDGDGNVVVDPFPFDNTSQGFAKLLLILGQAGATLTAASAWRLPATTG